MDPRLAIALVAIVAALGGGFWGGWEFRDGRAAKADRDRLEAQQAQARTDLNRIEKAATNYVAAEAKVEERERVVYKEVLRVVSKPVYREQCLDDDGMRLLADDAAASNARRQLAPAVPAGSAPR